MTRVLAVCLLMILGAQSGFSVTIGQVDTFESSLANWFAGGGPLGQIPPSPPVVIETGGPAGVDDAYLQITSIGGAAAGSRLVAMNAVQWAGDYLAAGIGGIEADVINLGQTALTLRLYFEDPIPGPPQNEAVSTTGINLPPGSGWQQVFFPISGTELTSLQGNTHTALANTTILRIFSGTQADFPPEPIVGVLGIDNIRAVAIVPEPGTLGAVTLALGALALVRRRRSASLF